MARRTAETDVVPVHDSYPLRTVTRLTGLSADLIRAWERRYGVVEPLRGPRGARLYSNEQISHLQLLAALVERGRSIGDIARLDRDALTSLLDEGRNEHAEASRGILSEETTASFSTRFFEAADAFDVDAASALLTDSALSLGSRDFIEEVVVPLLTEVGDRWEDGKLSIAREHMISKIVRDFLCSFGRLRRLAGPPAVVLATPQGERHEFGILVAGMVLMENAVPVLSLGADLPAVEIVDAVGDIKPRAIALSVVGHQNRESAAETVRQIDAGLPADIEIWLGGADARAVADMAGSPRTQLMVDTAALDRAGARISGASAG